MNNLCADCKRNPRMPGRSYCVTCNRIRQWNYQQKKDSQNRLDLIGDRTDRFERLVRWCRRNKISELAKRLNEGWK